MAEGLESVPATPLNLSPTHSAQNPDNPPNAFLSRVGGRIRGKPPLLADVMLAYYSTGLFNGEGCSYYRNGTRIRRSASINITMCDRDALEPAGRWWGVEVRKRTGKAKVCANGPAYRIDTSGLRAEMIMNEMRKYGLSVRKVEQWNKVLSRCSGGVGSSAAVAQPGKNVG